MTIASEIDRLQCAKADICTAIENKWVTVWNITLDCYAPCIDAIQTWWGVSPNIDFLLVGWGWWGGINNVGSGMNAIWWWGWAWWIVVCCNYPVSWEYCITVGTWWAVNNKWWDSCFNDIVAYWWGYWWRWNGTWWNWWSWWWGASCAYTTAWWSWCGWVPRLQWCSWTSWGDIRYCWRWWWPNNWWWMTSDITWYQICIWTGWRPYTCPVCSYCWSWWNWWFTASNQAVICAATNWCQWLVVVRYKTDWSMWINCATWWCVYTCWEYTIHCFTSNDTFTVVS